MVLLNLFPFSEIVVQMKIHCFWQKKYQKEINIYLLSVWHDLLFKNEKNTQSYLFLVKHKSINSDNFCDYSLIYMNSVIYFCFCKLAAI